MAKKPEDTDDASEKMTSESLDFLEQVRKGKPRNFVMSTKGAKVRSLMVKKKRLKDKEIKEARGGGFQPMYGVLEGQGLNITFNIAQSDGFEKDPLGGKVAKLKEFLKEQTGKALKPTVKLVATPPVIPFDENDLKNPYISRFMSLSGLINDVVTQHPESMDKVQTRINEIRLLLQDDDTIESSGAKIDELEKFLHSFDIKPTSPTESTSTTETSSPETSSTETTSTTEEASPTDPGDLADKLLEGLKKLKPAVQEAIQLAPDKKDVLVTSMSQVVNAIKAEELDEAKTKMVTLSKLVKEIKAREDSPTPEIDSSTNESTTTSDPTNTESTTQSDSTTQTDSKELIAKLSQQLKNSKVAADKVINLMPAKKSELYEKIAEIAGQIKNKEFDKAEESLKQFGQTLRDLAAAATPPKKDQQQELRSEFDQRKQKLESQYLEALRAAPDQKNGLMNSWNYAEDQAGQQNYDIALKKLGELEKEVAKVLAAPKKSDAKKLGIPEGLVAERAKEFEQYAKTQIEKSKVTMRTEIAKIDSAMKQMIEDDDVQDFAESLTLALDDIYDKAFGRINNVLTKSSFDKVKAEVEACKKQIESDPLVKHLESASNIGVKPKVLSRFHKLFEDLGKQIDTVSTL